MKHLKLFISHCWYSLICLYFFSVSSRPIKFSAVLSRHFARNVTVNSNWVLLFDFQGGSGGFGCHSTHPPWSLCFVAPSMCRSLNVCYTLTSVIYIDRIESLAFSPQCCTLQLEFFVSLFTVVHCKVWLSDTTGNNVGKWHFGFVWTVKRSVFMARSLSTVMFTSHCL